MKKYTELEKAQRLYPIEYDIATRLKYPEKYIPIACKWLHEWRGWEDCHISETGLGYDLLQWEKYVGDKEPIENITDTNDLTHTWWEYKTLGHRDPNRKFFMQKGYEEWKKSEKERRERERRERYELFLSKL